MKIGVIIQARMGSTRLPGKVLKRLDHKFILEHVIERIKQSKLINEIIIATTVNKEDDAIEELANKLTIKCFRGSMDDVLSRYYYAASEWNLDAIVRITSDCPLIDPKVVDEIVEFYCKNAQNYDIVSNAVSDLTQRTYPRGLDTEVFSFEILSKAFEMADKPYQHEHVTPYIYENGRTYTYKNVVNFSKYRWTLDTQDDFSMISLIYENLYKGTHDFYMNDIVEFLKDHPEISKINEHVEQKKIETEG